MTDKSTDKNTNDKNIKKKPVLLFCHIPKCSGTNTRIFLANYHRHKKTKEITQFSAIKWYDHHILKHNIELYKDSYKFAIIRDPVERLISLYFSQTMQHHTKTKKYNAHYKKYNISDIRSFLDNFVNYYEHEVEPYIDQLEEKNKGNIRIWDPIYFLPQHYFICDDKGKILVNDVVNIKNIDKFLYDKFKIINNKRRNTHSLSEQNYYQYVTEKNLKDIKKIYKDDYTYLFNKKPKLSK